MKKTAAIKDARPALQVGDEIDVPDLVARIKFDVGEILQHLRSASTEIVAEIEPIPVSARCIENIYLLTTGERFIISSRRKCECPLGIDGVLFRGVDGELSWSHHKSLDAFQRDVADDEKWDEYQNGVARDWNGRVRFRSEILSDNGDVISTGLRPAQLGALHSVAGHWELESAPCTVVMPTGTGKTEVMLATSVHVACQGTMLVVVPTVPLRDQTVRKFSTLGLLRQLGVIDEDARNPIVGVITHRPKSIEDLQIFKRCHIVVSTMASLSQGTAVPLQDELSKMVATLAIDEAHHVAASTWSEFREKFLGKRILQLSATPYRRDGKVVDGRIVFEYGLGRAQADGYFRAIEFKPVFEFDERKGDLEIAKLAVSQLKDDLTGGYEHLVMARCASIERATDIAEVYRQIAPEFAPIVVHSRMGSQAKENLRALREYRSRIVVCVDMLGEGFDLPNLKIAAVHDTHKSLAVLLQFSGRFTRSSGEAIGTATMVANIASQEVSVALERLYKEDADWNLLLSEYSSQAAKNHRELIEFLEQSKRLDVGSDADVIISQNLLRPKCSASVFRCSTFSPERFYDSISKTTSVKACWLHRESNTLYFATRRELKVDWSRSKEIRDVCWDLFVVHYDAKRELLFIGSSDRSSLHEMLATAVSADNSTLIRGDDVFRVLGHISRLRFNQIGVKKAGRRNLSYAMYTGSDVQTALTSSQKAGSYKSNLAGSGFASGEPVTVGCSYKGRIWSKDKGTIREFIDWCDVVGEKLVDRSIDPSGIIENVLVPEEVFSIPHGAQVLSVDWPEEITRQSFDRVIITNGRQKTDLSFVDIEHVETNSKANEIRFRVRASDWTSTYTMFVGGTNGYDIALKSGPILGVKAGRLGPMPLADYLRSYPPLFLLSDLSELNGNLWVRPKEKTAFQIPNDRFETWDWTGVNIKQESMWKDGTLRTDSVQHRVARQFLGAGIDVLYDDDAAGEAADLVGLRELSDTIELSLIHCKFAGGETAGERVKDIVEVCSQAIRSAKWKWKFKELCKHIVRRENTLAKDGRTTRFLSGGASEVNRFLRLHRSKEIKTRIIIVQPGLKEDCTIDQRYVLAATDSYLLETIGVNLEVICSD